MRKILVINVNWLGDVIFSTPALRALRENFPDAHIGCLVISRCEEVLKNNKRINEVIVYDEYGKHRSFFAKLKFIKYLRKKRFDEVYILHRSLKRAMIGFLAGIPNRIGYDANGRAFLLTKVIPAPEVLMHKIDYFLNLLSACGIKTNNRACEFFISADDENDAKRILENASVKSTDKFVVINPGGNWLLKRWTVKNFAKLADLLIEKKEIKVLISGAKNDQVLAQQIVALMKHKGLIITGITTLHQLAAIMRQAVCVVSADSGPMHIAVAVGANTVAIFGPTSPRLTGPEGEGEVVVLQEDVGCEVPCFKNNCTENRCMEIITAEDVFAQVCKFID